MPVRLFTVNSDLELSPGTATKLSTPLLMVGAIGSVFGFRIVRPCFWEWKLIRAETS